MWHCENKHAHDCTDDMNSPSSFHLNYLSVATVFRMKIPDNFLWMIQKNGEPTLERNVAVEISKCHFKAASATNSLPCIWGEKLAANTEADPEVANQSKIIPQHFSEKIWFVIWVNQNWRDVMWSLNLNHFWQPNMGKFLYIMYFVSTCT